jgi:hypothetical protein
VFGNRDTLDVAVAIGRQGDSAVNATDLSRDLGIAVNRVRSQLVAFADADLLRELDIGNSGKRWFVRRDSRFWELCAALAQEWRD